MRFYFVSWLGERVVADIRAAVQDNLLRLAPGLLRGEQPEGNLLRMTSDTALIEQVVGTTVSVALRNLLMAIGGIVYLFWLAPQLTLLAGAGDPRGGDPDRACSAAGCATSRAPARTGSPISAR